MMNFFKLFKGVKKLKPYLILLSTVFCIGFVYYFYFKLNILFNFTYFFKYTNYLLKNKFYRKYLNLRFFLLKRLKYNFSIISFNLRLFFRKIATYSTSFFNKNPENICTLEYNINDTIEDYVLEEYSFQERILHLIFLKYTKFIEFIMLNKILGIPVYVIILASLGFLFSIVSYLFFDYFFVNIIIFLGAMNEIPVIIPQINPHIENLILNKVPFLRKVYNLLEPYMFLIKVIILFVLVIFMTVLYNYWDEVSPVLKKMHIFLVQKTISGGGYIIVYMKGKSPTLFKFLKTTGIIIYEKILKPTGSFFIKHVIIPIRVFFTIIFKFIYFSILGTIFNHILKPLFQKIYGILYTFISTNIGPYFFYFRDLFYNIFMDFIFPIILSLLWMFCIIFSYIFIWLFGNSLLFLVFFTYIYFKISKIFQFKDFKDFINSIRTSVIVTSVTHNPIVKVIWYLTSTFFRNIYSICTVFYSRQPSLSINLIVEIYSVCSFIVALPYFAYVGLFDMSDVKYALYVVLSKDILLAVVSFLDFIFIVCVRFMYTFYELLSSFSPKSRTVYFYSSLDRVFLEPYFLDIYYFELYSILHCTNKFVYEALEHFSVIKKRIEHKNNTKNEQWFKNHNEIIPDTQDKMELYIIDALMLQTVTPYISAGKLRNILTKQIKNATNHKLIDTSTGVYKYYSLNSAYEDENINTKGIHAYLDFKLNQGNYHFINNAITKSNLEFFSIISNYVYNISEDTINPDVNILSFIQNNTSKRGNLINKLAYITYTDEESTQYNFFRYKSNLRYINKFITDYYTCGSGSVRSSEIADRRSQIIYEVTDPDIENCLQSLSFKDNWKRNLRILNNYDVLCNIKNNARRSSSLKMADIDINEFWRILIYTETTSATSKKCILKPFKVEDISKHFPKFFLDRKILCVYVDKNKGCHKFSNNNLNPNRSHFSELYDFFSRLQKMPASFEPYYFL